jgi:hypothetical protein
MFLNLLMMGGGTYSQNRLDHPRNDSDHLSC